MLPKSGGFAQVLARFSFAFVSRSSCWKLNGILNFNFDLISLILKCYLCNKWSASTAMVSAFCSWSSPSAPTEINRKKQILSFICLKEPLQVFQLCYKQVSQILGLNTGINHSMFLLKRTFKKTCQVHSWVLNILCAETRRATGAINEMNSCISSACDHCVLCKQRGSAVYSNLAVS